MILDRLLANIVVTVEPFALCLLNTGWRLGLPGPSDTMFHFVLEGSGVLRGPDGRAQPIGRYNLAVVPSGARHSLECGSEVTAERDIASHPSGEGIVRLVAGSTDPADMKVACGVVHVAYGDSLGLFQHLTDVVIADLSHDPKVRDAFEGLLKEQAEAAPGSEALISAYMNQCMVHLMRDLCPKPDCPLPWLSALDDPALSAAVDAILMDIAAPHTLESLADAASMSRSTFSERFRTAFDCTPMTFIRDVRLRRGAQALLRSSRSVDLIARKVGFSSRSHFTQLFTARFGVSPASYRESQLVDNGSAPPASNSRTRNQGVKNSRPQGDLH